MEDQKKPRYVRVSSTGDMGLVLHDYVQPASQWAGPHDVTMIVVDNPAWRKPRHLKPGEYTEAPGYRPPLNQNFTRTKEVNSTPPPEINWRSVAEQAQLRIADLERQLDLLKAQLPVDND